MRYVFIETFNSSCKLHMRKHMPHLDQCLPHYNFGNKHVLNIMYDCLSFELLLGSE